jgi:hypothetical protein
VVVVDYDGILDRAGYPDSGKIDTFVVACLGDLRDKGARIVLNTCRTGEYLDSAVRLCRDAGLRFDAVNENLPHLIWQYGDCRKLGGDIYIDDKDICFSRIRLYWRLLILSLSYPRPGPWTHR